MTCPRCREKQDILRYVPMGQVEEFIDETVPVYKCPSCRWIFAPATNVREDFAMFNDKTADVQLSDPSYSDIAEVHLAGTSQEEHDGLVRKVVLRTGSWPCIPTSGGLVNKPLQIIRDGKSDKDKGIIALSELVENFGKVGQRVQIPLTDTDSNDHKNQLRLNTGFVKNLFIVDEDGCSKLVADMDFTEPDVKDKVLRGTFADVSCGIPWEFSSRGAKYGAFLEHVCITNRPFIDDLGPFLALSDGNEGAEVIHFAGSDPDPEPVTVPKIEYRDPFGGLSLKAVLEQAENAVPDALKETFVVRDVRSNGIVIVNDEQKMSWLVPFVIEEGKLASKIDGWSLLDYQEPASPQPPAPASPEAPEPPPTPVAPEQPESSGDPVDKELEAARQQRNLRLGAVAASQTPMKEATMPLTREELEALNLSDLPEGQRAVFQKLLNENSTLTLSSREAEANTRVNELEELGLKDFPGALKLYRQVYLGDDGGPAVVVLSDDGKTKESKTALSILDDFIEAIKGQSGKVVLSDQAVLVPDDKKPPETPEGEKAPLADRVAAAKVALTGVNG
jgi:hypothetical protein